MKTKENKNRALVINWAEQLISSHEEGNTSLKSLLERAIEDNLLESLLSFLNDNPVFWRRIPKIEEFLVLDVETQTFTIKNKKCDCCGESKPILDFYVKSCHQLKGSEFDARGPCIPCWKETNGKTLPEKIKNESSLDSFMKREKPESGTRSFKAQVASRMESMGVIK